MEYSEVPYEMKQVANYFGYSRLCEIDLEAFCKELPKIGKKVENDRAILRAIHFFEENNRVTDMINAIFRKDVKQILKMLTASGKSSWELLQNCYSISNYKEQKVTLCLALTELFLKEIGDGCCRVHGGEFAEVIMCVLPKKFIDTYIQFITAYVGKNDVYPMNIRQVGAIHLENKKKMRVDRRFEVSFVKIWYRIRM